MEQEITKILDTMELYNLRGDYHSMIMYYLDNFTVLKPYWSPQCNGKFKKKMPQRKVITHEENLNILDLPNKAGLYLIGEVRANPNNINDLIYSVKIGSASDLKKRCRAYNTYHSEVWLVDYLLIENENYLSNFEEILQERLYNISYAKYKNNKEWFDLDRDTYLALTNKNSEVRGFKYFSPTLEILKEFM